MRQRSFEGSRRVQDESLVCRNHDDHRQFIVRNEYVDMLIYFGYDDRWEV
jgi:hypothetical protein